MKNKGFTLIELLIVIGLLAVLALVVLMATADSRAKGRDAKRLSDVKEVEKALSLYYSDNGSYPISPNGSWAGSATNWGGYTDSGASGYIPNLAPTYISKLPVDPKQEDDKGYIYKSNGTDYFFLSYKTLEKINTPISLQRPSNPGSNDLAIYTPGFANQTIPGEEGGGGEPDVPPQTPVASIPPGTHVSYVPSDRSLLFSSDSGATIYYTQGGSSLPANPTQSSSLYTGPISLPMSGSISFKAIAIKNGLSSGIFSGQYFIIPGVAPIGP